MRSCFHKATSIINVPHNEILFHFLTRLGYKCPLGFNAAEYYVSLLGVQLDKEKESRDRIRRICDEYQRSDVAAEIETQVGDIKDETEYFNGIVDKKVGGEDITIYTLVARQGAIGKKRHLSANWFNSQ